MLASSVGTTVSASETTTTVATSAPSEDQTLVPKSVAKIIVANNATVNSSTAVLQKVVNSPLITVLNPSGPLTVVKSICVTSGVTSSPQFTLVNTLTNSGKSITLVNAAPVTLVKALPNIATTVEQCSASRENTNNNNNNNVSVATSAAADKAVTAVHNVFVKNTCAPDLVPASQDVVPQSHKILTANAFPQTVSQFFFYVSDNWIVFLFVNPLQFSTSCLPIVFDNLCYFDRIQIRIQTCLFQLS